MSEETSLSAKGCFPKVSSGTWRSLFGAITSTNRVYPSEPVPPKDSEFIFIESKIKIRVIHLTPEKVRQSSLIKQVSSSSVSEEYWFMKGKPLWNASCRCSFKSAVKKSYRISAVSNRSSIQKDTWLNRSLDADLELVSIWSNKSKVIKVEQFVEQLVEKTLAEALNECFKLNFDGSGVANMAYESTEVDSSVITNGSYFNKFREKNGEQSNWCASSKKCEHTRIKPLIMLVHGLGSTADIWSILMHNLSFKGFEVIAPDLLAHGFSSAPTKPSLYQFKNLVGQILAIFDYFMKREDKRKCILIGHSYGCSLITALYPNRASKIAQLVLISGGGPTPLAPPADLNDISPYGCAHNFCYPFMYCGLKRSFFYSSRGKNFRFCENESSVPPTVKKFLLHGQHWPEGDASFHRRILVPTLLVHGLQDKNVTLVQECEMERTIPRSFLELIPDGGHMSMIESPEELTHMINCFIEMWS